MTVGRSASHRPVNSSCWIARVCASRAANGSSISRTLGFCTRVRAMATRWRMPCERCRTSESANSCRRTLRSHSSARTRRSSLGTPRISMPSSTLLRTRRQGSRASRAKRNAASLLPGRTGLPSMRTLPARGFRRLPTMPRAVVLPQPDGPTMLTNSEGSMRRLKLSNTRTGRSPWRKLWFTFWNSTETPLAVDGVAVDSIASVSLSPVERRVELGIVAPVISLRGRPVWQSAVVHDC